LRRLEAENVVTHYLIGMAQATGGSGGLMQMAPLVLIFAVFYLLVIRPQSKKAKVHQQMLTELKKGDDVVTQGGIIGRITGLKDDEVTLQVQEGVRLRILRSAITGPRKLGEKSGDKTGDKSDRAVEKSSEAPKDVKAS
jgi:preprotein translocase subunit YajC